MTEQTITVPTEIDALRAELETVKRERRSIDLERMIAVGERSMAVSILRHLIDEHDMSDEIKEYAVENDYADFARDVLDIDVTRKFSVTLQYVTEVYVTVDADDEDDAREKAAEVDVRIHVDGDIDGCDTDYYDPEVSYCEESE